jgi:hypothetical protein
MGLFVQRVGAAWWSWVSWSVFGGSVLTVMPLINTEISSAQEEYMASMAQFEDAIQSAVLGMILSGQRVPEDLGDRVRNAALSSAWRALV